MEMNIQKTKVIYNSMIYTFVNHVRCKKKEEIEKLFI